MEWQYAIWVFGNMDIMLRWKYVQVTEKWTWLGFMVVLRKQWTFRIKFQNICCSSLGVLFGLDIMERKDEPPEVTRKGHYSKGKAVGLFLLLTKYLHTTGIMVVMDSIFCVLQELVELIIVGLFRLVLTKKCHYWTRYVKGDETRDNCNVRSRDIWTQLGEI